MRILHLTPYFYPAWAYGGTCRAAWELARASARLGHEVIAFTTDALDVTRRATPETETVEGVNIRRFKNISNRLAWARLFVPLSLPFHLENAIRAADVVHLHEYRSLIAAMVLPVLERLHKPLIITAQGGMPLLAGRFALKRFYDSSIGHRLLNHATRLHALNGMEAKQYVEAGGQLRKVFTAPNCLNIAEYQNLPAHNTFRAQHNIASDVPLVLFLARINKIKGVDFLVSAFAEVARTLPDAVLAIVGPDDGFLPEVKAQIKTLGIQDRVRFIGYVDGAAKLEAYQASDVYVLPSNYEILGITLLEALACRTPVITTERCGLADDITQNQLGGVVAYGNVTELSNALLDTLKNRAPSQAEAERRRVYVLENYDWDTVAKSWETVYAECAAIKS
jgi:glycosyltransferase involved in cell wall biosynthesis